MDVRLETDGLFTVFQVEPSVVSITAGCASTTPTATQVVEFGHDTFAIESSPDGGVCRFHDPFTYLAMLEPAAATHSVGDEHEIEAAETAEVATLQASPPLLVVIIPPPPPA
jgi:hypothetical protein